MRAPRHWALVGFVGMVGAVALPVGLSVLDDLGPAGRVQFFPYLFDGSLLKYGLAVVVGAVLGVGVVPTRSIEGTTARPRRWRWRLLLLVASMGWFLWPHLTAFPARGSLAERDAWARANVKEYPSLVTVVSALPGVVGDVGRVTAVAPTGEDRHRFAREMNGDDLRFVLDVEGERGRGVLAVVCTLDGPRVLDWQSGELRFGGKVSPVAPELPPPAH